MSTQSDERPNPFANFGEIVSGPRFIGRKESLQFILAKVNVNGKPGNVSIVGERRIGKSSLAGQTIEEGRTEFIRRGILPVWLYVPSYETPEQFFAGLVNESLFELEAQNWSSELIRQAAARVCNSERTGPYWDAVLAYFRRLTEKKIYILFVLDEFEKTIELFRNASIGFQRLRDLCQRFVGIITTSRHMIHEIEVTASGTSTLYGVFDTRMLRMFDSNDMMQHYARYLLAGIELCSAEQGQIQSICGRHPYLLDLLGFEIVQIFQQRGVIDIDRAVQDSDFKLKGYFDSLVKLLRTDGALDALVQIAAAGNAQVDSEQVYFLQRRGLIEPAAGGYYVQFSAYFRSYLLGLSFQRSPQSPHALKQNERLANGRYVIKRRVAETLNSVVYQAIDTAVGDRLVAIKELKYYGDAEEDARRKARHELESIIGARIDHPFLVKVIDFVGERYIVQPWVDGQSMRALLSPGESHAPQLLSVPRVIKIGLEVADALNYACTNFGMVHRDIKPEHIYLLKSNYICIIDFGLAQAKALTASGALTGETAVGGTSNYNAPEQDEPGAKIDQRADIFGLGVTLYELLTGQRAFPRGASIPGRYTDGGIPTPSSIRHRREVYQSGLDTVPEALDHCIAKAIRPNRDERFASWDLFIQALESIERELR